MITAASETSTSTIMGGQKATLGGAAALTSDFETFLKMLTAQARYQDPLDPIDSTEYAAQLAQFSMVEQQVLTNDRLSALSAGFDAFTTASLASWIGLEARAVVPGYFGGAPVTVVPTPAKTADAAVRVVTDADGSIVQRMPISTTGDPLEWTGLDENGTPFPPGPYVFEAESWQNGELLSTSLAAVFSRIAEARLDDGKVMLVMNGGSVVASSDVTALRNPS